MTLVENVNTFNLKNPQVLKLKCLFSCNPILSVAAVAFAVVEARGHPIEFMDKSQIIPGLDQVPPAA